MKPYSEIKSNNYIIREFDSNNSDEEFIWHRDRSDRKIFVIESDGWKFQRDNSKPFEMKSGDIFSINKMEYHRIIKGNKNLKILIEEF